MEIKEFAVIVAGGSGSRMKSSVPKQFLMLNGLPVLMHTIQAFYHYNSSITIIVVLPEQEIPTWNRLCKQYTFQIPHIIQQGGSTRFLSVKNGLSLIKEDSGVVAIHDGVRPLVQLETIQKCFAEAKRNGNAIAAVGLKDSIREVDNKGFNRSVDRNNYYLVQTPQTFLVKQIKSAYFSTDDKGFTDDAAIAESLGEKINLVEGSYSNLKITTQEDLIIANALMQEQRKMK